MDTGLPGGPARVVSVGEQAKGWKYHSEFVEIAVPVSRVADDAFTQAREFRRVGDAVRTALGDASYLGSQGTLGPYGRTNEVGWGTPYMRWRNGGTTLELRGGTAGPELVLQASSPWESWYEWLQDSPDQATGFIATHRDAPPLEHPGFDHSAGWDELGDVLACFLATLPAETLALGLPLSFPLFGFVPGGDIPNLIGLYCDDCLYLGYNEPETADLGARGANVAALGWESADLLPRGNVRPGDDGEPPWRIDAGGPGECEPPRQRTSS